MMHNMRDAYRYGFKVSIQTASSQTYSQKANLMVVLKAPNGYADIARKEITLPAKGSTWYYALLGDTFFSGLLSDTGSIPTGSYTLTLYLNCELVKEISFEVK